jgi:GNAT superfamily N-acetyltransferase
MKPGIRQHGPATLKLSFNKTIPAHLRGNILEVTHLLTPDQHRGQGYASLLMQKLCAEADEAGKVLLLMPKPYDDAPMDREALVSFYQRFGFEVIQEHPVLMARPPGAAATVTIKPLAYAMGMH